MDPAFLGGWAWGFCKGQWGSLSVDGSNISMLGARDRAEIRRGRGRESRARLPREGKRAGNPGREGEKETPSCLGSDGEVKTANDSSPATS